MHALLVIMHTECFDCKQAALTLYAEQAGFVDERKRSEAAARSVAAARWLGSMGARPVRTASAFCICWLWCDADMYAGKESGACGGSRGVFRNARDRVCELLLV